MMLLTFVFCVPFCAPPACPSVLVRQFLLPLGNGAPARFVPARHPDFHVPGGTLSSHPLVPQTSSIGPRTVIRAVAVRSGQIRNIRGPSCTVNTHILYIFIVWLPGSSVVCPGAEPAAGQGQRGDAVSLQEEQWSQVGQEESELTGWSGVAVPVETGVAEAPPGRKVRGYRP